MQPPFKYRALILEALAGHGLVPRADTPPTLLRDAVRDLYRYEIKRLRLSLLAGHIAKRDYADHVVALRRKYPSCRCRWCLWVDGGRRRGRRKGFTTELTELTGGWLHAGRRPRDRATRGATSRLRYPR